MGFVICYAERSVKAKGLNKLAKPNEEKVKQYFFPDDYEKLSLLFGVQKIEYQKNPVLFYPGCGVDILLPLKYVEALFPSLRNITFVFSDLDNNFGLIKTVLDEIGISLAELKKNTLQFYWNGILVNFTFIQGNVLEILSVLPAFDIYFERAFRIMKDYLPGYEKSIYEKLKPKGILISDSGFQHVPLEKIKVSQELSAYKEMIIGVKK